MLGSAVRRFHCFNTASGMDCMQFEDYLFSQMLLTGVSIPQAVWIACNETIDKERRSVWFVSIPQAVWIACNKWEELPWKQLLWRFNTASGMDCMQFPFFFNNSFYRSSFQYRKRYGLHAIPSLTALGTAEPRSGFSKRIALFGKSPQPRGIFLSPKSAENVRKPCNIKETFVHGKNLKLMAFSRESLPSL